MNALPAPKLARATLQGLLLIATLASADLRAQGAPIAANVPARSRWVLKSPAMVFELVAGEELKAASWENRLTGHRLKLGGEELSLDIGESPQQPQRFDFA